MIGTLEAKTGYDGGGCRCGCGPGLGGSAAIKFAREGFAIAAFNRTPETFAPTKDQTQVQSSAEASKF